MNEHASKAFRAFTNGRHLSVVDHVLCYCECRGMSPCATAVAHGNVMKAVHDEAHRQGVDPSIIPMDFVGRPDLGGFAETYVKAVGEVQEGTYLDQLEEAARPLTA